MYHVSFTAIDTAGNAQTYNFSFSVDKQQPAAPMITGDDIASGTIRVRPAPNNANSTTVFLTGTREDTTAVWIDNQLRVPAGSGDWSVDLTLNQGNNSLEIWTVDAAGNRSPSVWVDIQVDSIAPAVTLVSPSANSFVNTPPASIVINYIEASGNLDLTDSILSVTDDQQLEVAGSWTESGGNRLTFIPSSPLSEADYTITLQLTDMLGNRGDTVLSAFTVDETPPPVPEIEPVISPTHSPAQIVTGTREAHAEILVNGEPTVARGASTDWQHMLNLVSGVNHFIFVARDRAGNQSESVGIEITFDDIPPPPVDTLAVNTRGDGTTVYLNWSDYDENLHGDVAHYRIFRQTSAFNDISGLTETGHRACRNFQLRRKESGPQHRLLVCRRRRRCHGQFSIGRRTCLRQSGRCDTPGSHNQSWRPVLFRTSGVQLGSVCGYGG